VSGSEGKFDQRALSAQSSRRGLKPSFALACALGALVRVMWHDDAAPPEFGAAGGFGCAVSAAAIDNGVFNRVPAHRIATSGHATFVGIVYRVQYRTTIMAWFRG